VRGGCGDPPRKALGPAVEQMLKPGDGVVFDEGRPAEDEQGGRVFSVQQRGGGKLFLTFGEGDVNLAAVSAGSTVWKTDDPRLRRELEKSYAREMVVRRVPLSVSITAQAGEPLRVTLSDGAGNRCEVASEQPVEAARNRPLTAELVREQFGRLGDTPFELAEVEILGDDGSPAASVPVMVPKSILNDLRRQAVERLLELRRAKARHAIAEPDALAAIRREISALRPPDTRAEAKPLLYVLVRNLDQLGAAIDCLPAAVHCDLPDISQCAEAVARSRAAGVPVGLATVRITKPGEENLYQGLLDAGPDMVLVRSLGALAFFRQSAPALPLVGDFSLNAANEITAAVLAETGLARITPAYDCNWTQLAAMLGRFPPARLEPVIHQHLPLMYMEHCVPAAYLSRGRDSASCGSVCERGRIELRDRVGADHPLVSDARCGSTLFSAHVQSAIDLVPEMLRAGVRHFRIELLRETADETRAIIDLYGRALTGCVDPESALAELRTREHAGVKRGTWDFE
jgi:putative protease